MRIATLLAALLFSAGAACAEDCAAGKAEAATAPTPGEATAPGNAATGWSGGLGGSQTGTNPQGAVAESRTDHPPTARGLDLQGEPEAESC